MRMNLNAHAVSTAGVSPHNGIVADYATGRVVQRRANRVMGRGTNINSRYQSFNLIGANKTAIDSHQHIGLRTHAQAIDSRVRMREGQMALLGEEHIVAQLL